MGSYAIRIDIDTVTCARKLTQLLQLSDKLGVRLSIYANFGKSIDRKLLIRSIFSHNIEKKSGTKKNSKKLSKTQKLGYWGLIETVLLNPPLSKRIISNLITAQQDGHEIGLHGGLNHGTWQHLANSMNRESIESLLLPALKQFINHFPEPFGFTSPGFTASHHAYNILKEHNCKYISDSFLNQNDRIRILTDIPNIDIDISGPDSIDFLEYLIATNQLDIEAKVTPFLNRKTNNIYYSHPNFVCGPGQKQFIELINILEERKNNTLVGNIQTSIS